MIMRRPLSVVFVPVWVLALALAGGGVVTGQSEEESLTVRAGAILFNRPEFDSVALVEFPFALNRSEYGFFQPDSSSSVWFARIFAQVNLYGNDGLPIDSASSYFSAAVADSAQAALRDYSLFNSLVLVVKPGLYSARLSIIDAVSKKEGEFFYDRLVVESPEKDRLAMGGKCLAYRLSYTSQAPSSERGVPKNGFEVMCNPDGLFSNRDTSAYVYAELYNLDYTGDSSVFRLSLAALDDSGRVYRQLGTKERPKPGRSAVIAESFDIAGWPLGSYALQISATDMSAGREVVHELPFKIISPLVAPPSSPGSETTDPGRTLDLETQLRLVRYLLTTPERATLNGLSEGGKAAFIERYWRERDSDPSTQRVENRIEMYERYLYANSFFSVTAGDGWSTDRGRILMLYGMWDQRDDESHPASGYPYQVWWYYSLKGGTVFVFQDEQGMGDYRLVHSSLPGEIFDAAWDDAIKSGVIESQ
jgi:GWxTD domain-containing protein